MLQRGLRALVAAFPSEFTDNARSICRERLRAGLEPMEAKINDSKACQMHGHLSRQLVARKAMLSASCSPEQTAEIEAKIKVLEADIQRVDDFLTPLRRRAADSERTAVLEACEKMRSASLDALLEIFNAEKFGHALTEYLAAETDRVVCGSDVDAFVANRTAILAESE